jgi:hypothetical protein
VGASESGARVPEGGKLIPELLRELILFAGLTAMIAIVIFLLALVVGGRYDQGWATTARLPTPDSPIATSTTATKKEHADAR